MLIAPVPIVLPAPKPDKPRTPGVHLSSIIKSIAKENGILTREDLEDLSLVEVQTSSDAWWRGLDDDVRLRISIGLAWEEWYLAHLGTIVFHPGEMQVDGIYMTHDGESVDAVSALSSPSDLTTPTLCLHEVKATYKSVNTVGDLSTQWMWVAQCKGYCRGLNTRVAFLHVLFLCGDYTYPIRPMLKCWQIEFTDEEILENWDVMAGYARLKGGL